VIEIRRARRPDRRLPGADGRCVDNIPGVPKCGPKTAAKWLAEYGSLDGVIANADKIKGKIGDNLRAALPRLPLNRELTTIKTDVALDGRPRPSCTCASAMSRPARAVRALRLQPGAEGTRRRRIVECVTAALEKEPGIARGTGFRRAGRRHRKRDSIPRCPRPANTNRPRHGAARCMGRRLQAAGEFAFDTETDSAGPDARQPGRPEFERRTRQGLLHPARARLAPAWPRSLPRDVVLDALRPLLADPAKKKLGQHGKYDLHVLRRHGVDVHGYADDTMLESFVLNAGIARHDMDSLAQRHLGYETIKYEDVAGKGAKQIRSRRSRWTTPPATPPRTPTSPCACIARAARSWQAEPALLSVYRDIEMPLVPVLARIEANGVMIDADELRRQSADLSRRMLAAQQKATELAGRSFNLDSPKQLRRAAVRRTEAAGAGEDAERPALDQRGSAGGDRRPARTAADHPGIPRPGETAQHLHRQAAGDGQSGHRPRAHQLPPGRRGDRAAVVLRSEPAEHPDPHRGWPPHPHRLRRAAGAQARGLRLLADRAADHGPPVRRPGLVRAFEAAPTSTARPRRKCSASRWKTSAATSAAPPRRSTSA
jgi:hypothetical protein